MHACMLLDDSGSCLEVTLIAWCAQTGAVRATLDASCSNRAEWRGYCRTAVTDVLLAQGWCDMIYYTLQRLGMVP